MNSDVLLHAGVGALKASALYALPTVLLLRRRPAFRTTAYMALFVGIARLVSRWLAAQNRKESALGDSQISLRSLVRRFPNAIAGAVAAALALSLMEPRAAVRSLISTLISIFIYLFIYLFVWCLSKK
jgi:hypothetical protein